MELFILREHCESTCRSRNETGGTNHAGSYMYHVYNENSALSQVVMNPCNHKILAVSHAVKDALKQ